MPSAVATTTIFPGSAVAQSKDTVSLAGGSILATHIVTSGAAPKGVVSMISSGVVFLNDWSLATGSKQLSTGSTYYAVTGGMLSTSGSQPIGIATSPTTLSVSIQSAQSQSSSSQSSNTSALAAQIAALQSQIISISSSIKKFYAGSFSITNGVNAGTVSGLGISDFVPTKTICTVRAQSGSLTMYASVIDTTITQDGFQFTLSSLTDSANYKLDFILLP